MFTESIRYGSQGPQGPWTRGPRGLGTIKQELSKNVYIYIYIHIYVYIYCLLYCLLNCRLNCLLDWHLLDWQQVPKCSQMRHGFDNMFQTYQTYQPTNLPTYQPTFIFIFISCACTTLLCMHNTLVHALEGPGPKARTQQKSGRRVRPGLVGW